MNRSILLFFLCVLLSNCAPPGNYYYHYDLDCANLESEFRLNEKGASYKFELASGFFDAKFGPSEFCRLSNKVTYYVRNTCDWDNLTGYTGIDNRIQLEKRMFALVHEITHVWDAEHFLLGTPNHEGWNKPEVGYDGNSISKYDLDHQFERAIAPLAGAHEEGFNLEELAFRTGKDGYECYYFQGNQEE